MSSTRIYAGFCPDEGCGARLMFPSYEAYVDCMHCGQRHEVTNVKEIKEITDQKYAIHTVLRTLMAQSNHGSRKAPDMVKVFGLSNYHCKLVSHLLTHYGMDKKTLKAKPLSELTDRATFDCSVLGERAFRIEPRHIDILGYGRDQSGSASYLAGTLARIKATNNNREVLIPIHADGDGHCLVHAVSRALVGRELFWHPLRTNLKQHLVQFLDKYKALFQDFINTSEWTGIIEECDPEYEPLEEGEPLGLRNIHVFGLANILRRPLILLDSLAGMKSSGDYSAVFLPALVSPDQCRGKSGELNKPLCLAWSSSAHNHYIPLVSVKGYSLPRIHRSFLPKVWAVPQSLLTDYVEFESDCVIIGGDKSLNDMYIKKLTLAMDELFLEKYRVHPALVADVEVARTKKHGAMLGMKPKIVVAATQQAVQERRLYRCLSCDGVCLLPFNSEWLRPGSKGVLYNLAMQMFGQLREDKIYSFNNYGVTCSYNAKKDVLILNKAQQTLDKCTWCQDPRIRLVHGDGSLTYENGDPTRTRSPAVGGHCQCGFKHWWAGNEYDDLPEMIRVVLPWGDRVVVETVAWFQHESDPNMNSNVYQVASYLVQKHFPGEFGSERLIQKVVEQILERTKHPEQDGGSRSQEDPECSDVETATGSDCKDASDNEAIGMVTFEQLQKLTRQRQLDEQSFKSKSKPSTLTSSDMCSDVAHSGSTPCDNSVPSSSTQCVVVREGTPPACSEGPVAIQLPGNRDQSKKMAAMTNVIESNPSLTNPLPESDQTDTCSDTLGADQSYIFSVQNQESRTIGADSLLQKAQIELRNQQKDYIQKKEREYLTSQMQKRTAHSIKSSRTLKDPGGFGKDKSHMGGVKSSAYDAHRRDEAPKLSGQRTVRMGPGYSVIAPPKARKLTPNQSMNMFRCTEDQLNSVNSQMVANKASDVLRNILCAVDRDSLKNYLNQPPNWNVASTSDIQRQTMPSTSNVQRQIMPSTSNVSKMSADLSTSACSKSVAGDVSASTIPTLNVAATTSGLHGAVINTDQQAQNEVLSSGSSTSTHTRTKDNRSSPDIM